MKNADTVLRNVRTIAATIRPQLAERQRRTHLDPGDFSNLRQIGIHKICIPEQAGGSWLDMQRSIRPLCDVHRILGAVDPSLALSATMHPGVLAFWRDSETPPKPEPAWERQKDEVYATVVEEGAWWATIASEPGSGGDIGKSAAKATPQTGQYSYRLTGEKHFGSGSTIASYMISPAIPDGETDPVWFIIDFRGVPGDGSAGISLRSEWEGHGMPTTDSHAFTFSDVPATRLA